MSVSKVVARKGNQTKTFSVLAWELLGDNKNGWEKISEDELKNSAELKPAVKTTPTKQVVSNKVSQKEVPAAQPIEPTIEEEPQAIVENTDVEAPVFNEGNKELFIAIAVEKLTKNAIKDYLDLIEKPFKANSSLPELAEVLHDALNGDIEVLKQKFEI